MFAVGDKVVHPGHGPGIIRGVERHQVVGEEKRYYIIDMLSGGTRLMTPVAQADKVGLRAAISDESMQQLLALLSNAPAALPDDFRERQSTIDERLKEGDVFDAARVARDMTWFGRLRGLTRRDTQLLQRAEELVAGELALVQSIEIKQAIDQMQAILASAMEEQPDR
jgi:CarD family transcriptional regulator